MLSLLAGKRIILGVSGSIAVYKAAEWTRQLRKAGAEVQVVMTPAATRFVAPLTFAALSGQAVHTDMFAPERAEEIPHINLARNCDLILLAPATAQTIARLANGFASQLLDTLLLAAACKVLVCPAMNSRMYLHPATQENLRRLASFGYEIIAPDTGMLACGEEGPGRLPDWPLVCSRIQAAFLPQDLQDEKILITAGPTREPLDPVRFLSNASTGKMGHALAATAQQRGARVTLISGPTHLPPPPGVELVRITTAAEMATAVLDHAQEYSLIAKCAAVSDFRPATPEKHKVKKTAAPTTLTLLANQDILHELGKRKRHAPSFPFLLGFAAESGNHRAEGLRKLRAKNLDLLVVNDILSAETGFAADTNQVLLLARDGGESALPLLSKEETAHRIWDRVRELRTALAPPPLPPDPSPTSPPPAE